MVTWQEWTEIVAKLNASFPRQPVEPMTAREWYAELADRPAGRVWEAIRRLRRGQSFTPSLAELLDTVALVARDEVSARPRLAAPDRPGVPAPAEAKRLLAQILRRQP
jgi:hypothetical protein